MKAHSAKRTATGYQLPKSPSGLFISALAVLWNINLLQNKKAGCRKLAARRNVDKKHLSSKIKMEGAFLFFICNEVHKNKSRIQKLPASLSKLPLQRIFYRIDFVCKLPLIQFRRNYRNITERAVRSFKGFTADIFFIFGVVAVVVNRVICIFPIKSFKFLRA